MDYGGPKSLFQRGYNLISTVKGDLSDLFTNYTNMQSPIVIALGGKRGVSEIEVMVYQSMGFPPVPQNSYPLHVQNGWHPPVPYNPMIDAKKRRNGNQYQGWKMEWSRGIYASRAAKKPNKAPVPLPRKDKRSRAHEHQPNKMPQRSSIPYLGKC